VVYGTTNAFGKLFRIETHESHRFDDPQKLRVVITIFFQLPRQAEEVFFTLLRHQLFKLVVNVHRYTGGYLPYVAMTLNNLGLLDRDQNRMAEARKDYEEALAIYEAFAQRDPELFKADVERLKRLLKELPK
jgi:hypothetical protein